MEVNQNSTRRVGSFVLTALCFLLFGGICFAAGVLLWHQGQEVEVSVDTPGDTFTESVTFTVSNVLGMDILIDDREDSCAMLQYREDGKWVDICEIRFVREDSASISVKYGGMYAHLAPGAELEYRLDEALLSSLQGGEYRIAIPYISEDEFLKYLQDRAEEIDESLLEQSELSEEVDTDLSGGEVSAESRAEEQNGEESEPVSAPKVQMFYKEFAIVGRE